MSIEIKAPTFPESVADGTVATWHKQPGEAVQRDELIVDIETDKELKEKVEAKKNKLSTMMLSAKNKGLKTQPAKKNEKQRLDCDTLETLY